MTFEGSTWGIKLTERINFFHCHWTYLVSNLFGWFEAYQQHFCAIILEAVGVLSLDVGDIINDILNRAVL